MAAEPRSGDDLAKLLMEKAAGDEKILFRLIDGNDITSGSSPLRYRVPNGIDPAGGQAVARGCG